MSDRDLSTRRFFMHPAHRSIGVSVVLGTPKRCNPNAPLRVCLAGALLGPANESLALLEHYLAGDQRFSCQRTFCPAEEDPWEVIRGEEYDCTLLIDPTQTGVSVLGRKLPARWQRPDSLPTNDYDHGPIEVQAAEEAVNHPILAGVGPFIASGPLLETCTAQDVLTLLIGTQNGRTEPVAWAQVHADGQTFHTSLGQEADFHQPAFLRLLRNALLQ